MKFERMEQLKQYLAEKEYTEEEEEILSLLDDNERWGKSNDKKIVDFMNRKGMILIDEGDICTSIANSSVTRQKMAVRLRQRHHSVLKHRHEYIEINYVADGENLITIEDRQLLLKKGDICIMDKNVQHSSNWMGENGWVFNLLLTEKFFDNVFMSLLEDDNYISNYIINSFYSENKQKRFLILHFEPGGFMDEVMEQIICEYYSWEICNMGKIKGCLAILFTELSRMAMDVDSREIPQKMSQTQADLRKYLQENYQNVTLQSAAEHMHFHPNYLSSLVKKETGKNFTEYVTEIRMSKAADLLMDTEWKVEGIASEIGYANEGYFYRQFRQKYKMTPKEYRKKYKKS